MTQFGYAVNEN